MSERNIYELPKRGNDIPPPPYNPNRNLEELWGIGTIMSLSGGLSVLLVSAVFSSHHPEAVYGIVGGVGLLTASVPGILYFVGREILISFDEAVHH